MTIDAQRFAQSFMAGYWQTRADDIAATVLLDRSGAWALSKAGRVVVRCPRCTEKIGVEADPSDGLPGEVGHVCDGCGMYLRLNLNWEMVPNLIGVEVRACQWRSS